MLVANYFASLCLGFPISKMVIKLEPFLLGYYEIKSVNTGYVTRTAPSMWPTFMKCSIVVELLSILAYSGLHSDTMEWLVE